MTHQNINTTLVKIASKDRDAVAKVCAINDLHVRFYTFEENEDLILVEIYCTTPSIMFYLGRQVEIELEMQKNTCPDLFSQLTEITKP